MTKESKREERPLSVVAEEIAGILRDIPVGQRGGVLELVNNMLKSDTVEVSGIEVVAREVTSTGMVAQRFICDNYASEAGLLTEDGLRLREESKAFLPALKALYISVHQHPQTYSAKMADGSWRTVAYTDFDQDVRPLDFFYEHREFPVTYGVTEDHLEKRSRNGNSSNVRNLYGRESLLSSYITDKYGEVKNGGYRIEVIREGENDEVVIHTLFGERGFRTRSNSGVINLILEKGVVDDVLNMMEKDPYNFLMGITGTVFTASAEDTKIVAGDHDLPKENWLFIEPAKKVEVLEVKVNKGFGYLEEIGRN